MYIDFCLEMNIILFYWKRWMSHGVIFFGRFKDGNYFFFEDSNIYCYNLLSLFFWETLFVFHVFFCDYLNFWQLSVCSCIFLWLFNFFWVKCTREVKCIPHLSDSEWGKCLMLIVTWLITQDISLPVWYFFKN